MQYTVNNVKTLKKSVGVKILDLRQKAKGHKISREKLAEDLNIDKITVYRWEKGIVAPPLSKLESVAQYFEIPICHFYEEDDVPPKTVEQLTDIVKRQDREIKQLTRQINFIPQDIFKAFSSIEDQAIWDSVRDALGLRLKFKKSRKKKTKKVAEWQK